MNSFLSAFETARKNGKFNPQTKQTTFEFTFEKYNIVNVSLLITKKQLDRRTRVDVLTNIGDRRSVILPTDDDLGRTHAVLTVTLPVADYDVHTHTGTHAARRSRIEAAMREYKQKKYAEFCATLEMEDQDACEMLHNHVFGKNSQAYMRFMQDLIVSGFSFKNTQAVDNFSAVVLNSLLMIVEHYTFDDKGFVDRLPGKYYYYYVNDRNVDRLPVPIADAKSFFNKINRKYGNYKFYNFCTWLLNLCRAELKGFDPDVARALEEERFAKRTMKFDKAPSRKPDDYKKSKQYHDEDVIVYDSPKREPKKKHFKNEIKTRPSGVSIGDMFGDALDSAVADK